MLVITMLGGGLIGLLILNTQRAQDAFTAATLAKQNAALADRQQALLTQVQQDRTPQQLAERAAALGMVPGGDPVFIDARGNVVGSPPPGAPVPTPHSPHVDGVVVAGVAHPAPSPAAANEPSAPAATTAASPAGSTR